MVSIKNTLLKIALPVLFVSFFSGCTKYNYEDGGTANPIVNSSMWNYMKGDPYNWQYTCDMIERAGLKEWFDGTRTEKITFFGVTHYSILRYILEHNATATSESEKWSDVKSIPVEECQNFLKKLIIPQSMLVTDIPRGNISNVQSPDGVLSTVETGGRTVEALLGSLFIYTYQEPYNDVPNVGRITIYIVSKSKVNAGKQMVVSSNIQTQTGVVHALSYKFNLYNI